MHRSIRTAVAAILFAAQAAPALASSRVVVEPSTFDFGWVPDNVKISSEFIVRNTGDEVVPLTSVVPSCGCTAAYFTAGAIGSSEQKKFSLTFNTRGFAGHPFNKISRIETDNSMVTYTATQIGHVLNANAALRPEGPGIAGFPANEDARKKEISILNNTGADVTLTVVQRSASWAEVTLPSAPIKNGGKGVVTISVTGPLKDVRSTSVTLAPAEDSSKNRFTLAIFTGEGNPPYRINPVGNPNPKPDAASKAAGTADAPAKAPAKKPAAPVKKVPATPQGAPAPK